MASCTAQGAKMLRGWRKPHAFDKGIGAELPEAYKKFWKEWKETTPTAVHYIHRDEQWDRNELTGEVKPVQNIPIPVLYPPEQDQGIWGGEGIIKGFQSRKRYGQKVPHFWVPVLKRSVVYSEVLDKYISVILTERTLRLIHEHYGFDHYLLKTLACDLKSLLALQIKRKILKALSQKCPAYENNAQKQEEIYNQYKKYLSSYTPEEIDWYGLSFVDACKKLRTEQTLAEKKEPLKHKLRFELIQKLREAGIKEAGTGEIDDKSKSEVSWLSRINPFTKKET